MVIIDYCKAFDMVNRELLLKKLEAYDIVNTELEWCRCYLTGRKQVVHLGGKESGEAPMEHGVPQGSILGPPFFILFINDLPLHVSSHVDLYADDTTLTASAHFNNLSELKLSLNISANKIHPWADSNKLQINESKSKVLKITGKRLASKINDELVVIVSKIRTFLSLEQGVLFYNAIIGPVMSFADVIWSSCDMEPLYRVSKLEKRAARVILYDDRLAPSATLFIKLGWIPFHEQSKISKFAIFISA